MPSSPLPAQASHDQKSLSRILVTTQAQIWWWMEKHQLRLRYAAIAFTSSGVSNLENPSQHWHFIGAPDGNPKASWPSQTSLPSAQTEVYRRCITGQSVSESKKPFQHPSGDPDNNPGACGTTQTSLPCSGPCLNALANVSATINQNTKMMELVVNHIVHGKHGVTSMQSSGVQDSIHGSDDETTLVTRRSTRMFRAHACPTVHKDANELQY
jgi:hypothetical protein